jgi:glutaredoxin
MSHFDLAVIFDSIAILSPLLVGGVFLITGLAKAVDPRLFVAHIGKLEILPLRAVRPASMAFIALECSLGYALILRLFPNWLFPTMLVLLVALSGLTYWSTATGRVEDCGCYSGLLQIKPQHSLLLNGIYIALITVGIYHPIAEFLNFHQQLWVMLLAIASSLVSVNLGVRKFRKTGRALLDLSLSRINSPWQPDWLPEDLDNLMQGKKLVAFISPNCGYCSRWVKALKVLHRHSIFPEIVALMSEPPEVIQAYMQENQLSFPVRFIKQSTKQLLVPGSPTVLVLEDGIITEKWFDTMPVEIVEQLRVCITQSLTNAAT